MKIKINLLLVSTKIILLIVLCSGCLGQVTNYYPTDEEINLLSKHGLDPNYVCRWPDGTVKVYDETNYPRLNELLNEINSIIGGPVTFVKSSSLNNSNVRLYNYYSEDFCTEYNTTYKQYGLFSYCVDKIEIGINSTNQCCETSSIKHNLYRSSLLWMACYRISDYEKDFSYWSTYSSHSNKFKKTVYVLYRLPIGYRYNDNSSNTTRSDSSENQPDSETNSGSTQGGEPPTRKNN